MYGLLQFYLCYSFQDKVFGCVIGRGCTRKILSLLPSQKITLKILFEQRMKKCLIFIYASGILSMPWPFILKAILCAVKDVMNRQD
jgi:hypothetical protein